MHYIKRTNKQFPFNYPTICHLHNMPYSRIAHLTRKSREPSCIPHKHLRRLMFKGKGFRTILRIHMRKYIQKSPELHDCTRRSCALHSWLTCEGRFNYLRCTKRARSKSKGQKMPSTILVTIFLYLETNKLTLNIQQLIKIPFIGSVIRRECLPLKSRATFPQTCEEIIKVMTFLKASSVQPSQWQLFLMQCNAVQCSAMQIELLYIEKCQFELHMENWLLIGPWDTES